MNNIHYIVEEIKGSSDMIEEDDLTKLSKDILDQGTWSCIVSEMRNYKIFCNGISKNML